MKKRLEVFTSQSGVHVEEEVQEEIEGIIDKHGPEIGALPGSDFRRIFWDQQVNKIAFVQVSCSLLSFSHVCLL